MYIKQSVHRAPGNPGLGIQTRDELILIDVDDIESMPSRNEAGVVIEGSIVMKPGTYAYGLYMTPGTVEVTSAAEGEVDNLGFTPSVKGTHPGNAIEVREFKTNNIGRRFIVLVRHCDGKPTDIIGDLCNPCNMVPSYTGSKDANSNEFTFTQISKGNDVGVYQGTITRETPVDTVATKATTVTFKGSGQYQLTDGTASITAITGGTDGAVITLLGAGGTTPPTVNHTAGKILLRRGAAFVASAGRQLTLKAFADSADSVIWIEVDRN